MKDNVKNTLIDKHYKESYKKENLIGIPNNEISKFENSLKNIAKEMHIPKTNDSSDINFFSIIEKAEKRKKEKKQKKENFYFLFTGLLLLSIISSVIFLLGTKFIIYFEIIITFFTLIFTVFIAKYYIKEKKL